MNSRLTRYQSAPSTYFSGFLDEILNRPPSPETERIFARFLSSTDNNTDNDPSDQNQNQSAPSIKKESPYDAAKELEQQAQFMGSMSNKAAAMIEPQLQQQSNYPPTSQCFYQSQSRPLFPDQNPDYRGMDPMGIDRFPPMKLAGGSNSSLIRHSSSPAGLFADIDIENGYAVMRGMGDHGGGNNTNGEASFSSSSRPPTSSGLMNELRNKNMRPNTPDSTAGHNTTNYVTGYPISSWNDSALRSENIGGIKGLGDEDRTHSGLSASETQNAENRPPPPLLSHHLSLPKSSIEKFLQLQDSVPCKVRAKRGCATHPRSIAERVRRTKISERMRKLQDLVPNMDKQTNTTDMLDLAVDYINGLQRQVKTLTDNRAKCTCSHKLQQ